MIKELCVGGCAYAYVCAGLTFLGECVAGGEALCVGDHAGEGPQVLQGGVVEDSSGPGRGWGGDMVQPPLPSTVGSVGPRTGEEMKENDAQLLNNCWTT